MSLATQPYAGQLAEYHKRLSTSRTRVYPAQIEDVRGLKARIWYRNDKGRIVAATVGLQKLHVTGGGLIDDVLP